MRRPTALERLREGLRLQQVYNVLIRYAGDAVVSGGVRGDFRRWWQRWLWKDPRLTEPLTNPVRLRLMLQELGPTYVKVGQLVSSRSGSMPREWEDELSKLHSDVPPFPYEDVRLRVEEELGGPPEEVYRTFDPTPLAAASLAQVHRATLEDEREVIVKIQRPHIESQVTADVGIMQTAARAAENRSRGAREIGALDIATEFGSNVIDELDYGIEAYNARRLRTNLVDLEHISVPEIHSTYSTKRLLTMDFVPGVKANDIEAIDAAGIDRSELTVAAVQAVVKMLLIDGFFHADPHPGNVLVSLEDGGTINFIDTGMTGELTVKQRINLIDLLVTGQQLDAKGLAGSLLSLSKPIGKREVDERAYYRDFERKLSPYLEGGVQHDFADRITASFDVLRDHRLRLDPELSLAVKALMQGEEITRRLQPDDPDFDFLKVSVDSTIELASEEITRDRIVDFVTDQASVVLRELANELPGLMTASRGWVDQYKKGRLEISVDTSGLEEQMDGFRAIARQLTIGTIVAGMVIGSAIAASIGQSQDLGFLTNLALVGFTATMIAGAVILILLISRWRRSERDDDI